MQTVEGGERQDEQRERERNARERKLFKEQKQVTQDAKADKQNWIIDALPTTWVFFLSLLYKYASLSLSLSL